MDSGMSRALAYISTAAALAVIASGCGHRVNSESDPVANITSSHTLQELCDIPKQFYKNEFNADNPSVSLAAGHPMTDKIEGGNACDYEILGHDTSDRNYLGQISLVHSTEATGDTTENSVTKTIVVDNTVIDESIPVDTGEFTTTEPHVTLSITVKGWHGKFTFWGRDDQTIAAGGKVLLNMMRTLTS
ncbi:hypothetical protein [Nocardia miyunensis]|uniref:hypothetical protein n=1 Tax=Nocardia miyunensis TaxID=282684 RepID=UPI0012F4BDF3|nr:hypothetical protein [Nocardia miyunensis]